MEAIPVIALISALAALGLAAFFFRAVKKESPGDARMVELMTAIQDGAKAFLRQEYVYVAVFVVFMAVVVGVLVAPLGAVTYVAGAILSGGAGYIGMMAATMANARTAEAAKAGPEKALPLAFRGGAVMGFAVAGLALGGLSITYILLVDVFEVEDAFQIFTAFALGVATIALFARIGGGIYTKAADVGADLVGKVEAGIPEDDPRNPATIADNVGDNVGDVAGMGADLFESYSGSIVAPIVLVAYTFGLHATDSTAQEVIHLLMFPLLVATVGMIAAIIGSFTIRTGASTDVHHLSKALHMGTNVAMALSIVGTFGAGYWLFDGATGIENWWGLPLSVVGGLAVGFGIGKVAEIWTSERYSPVRKIARQAETGPATVILSGISAGMVSVAASVLLVAAGVLVSYWGGEQAGAGLGIYGIAVAAVGMLATTGVVVAVDAYGPISDNAGGIAEMAGLDPSVREVTDALDSLGNTTAAIAKGFAIGSAALTALALFKTFEQAIVTANDQVVLSLNVGEVDVFVGLILGAMIPFVYAALTIDAVGRAANAMIEEVRRQFREIPGLREGLPGVRPDSERCVAISTKASLREMILPGSLAIFVPFIIGMISIDALGGFLAGALVTGFCLAIFMANAGGAWDNAKKYIEAGAHGGKGSEPHRAAVVGDTVGDPFKDTSGPAMSTLIKEMAIVALLFAPVFV